MQNFTIEVVSVVPEGINSAQRIQWKQNIQASNIDQALIQYKNMMQSQLPSNHTYTLRISNACGKTEDVQWKK